MSAPAILGVTRAQPRIDLGVGDSRDATGLGQWQPDAGNPADSRWQADDAVALDTARWNGEEPYWVDVTCYGIEVETYTGHDRAADEWDVGTATIVLDNASGWADFPPTIEPNPFDLTVRPGRQIRVAMVVDGGEPRVLWRGWVDQANPGFDVEYGDVVTLECIDAKGEAGRVGVATEAAPVGSGESIDARLDRICAAAVWPDYWRNFDASGINVVATTMGGQAVDLLNRAADSGGGALFGDIDGKLRYRNRDWQLWAAADFEDGTIGNQSGPYYPVAPLVENPEGSGLYELLIFDEDPDGSGLVDATGVTVTEDPAGTELVEVEGVVLVEDPTGSGLVDPAVYLDEDPDGSYLFDASGSDPPLIEQPPGSYLFTFGGSTGDWCPSSWEMGFAREDIATQVIIGRPDMATPIVLNDVDAQEIYGVETLERVDLETSLSADLTQIGNRLLVTRGHTTMPRIAGVTLNAATNPGVVDLLATADPRTPSRYRCRHSVGARQVFERQLLCTAVRHTIGPDMWETRLSLDDAMPWQVGGDNPGFWYDTETVGAGHWQESTWGADITP